MAKPGSLLEARVAELEHALSEGRFKFKKNVRKIDDDGVQRAEFDIEVSGTIGSASYRALIQCRDRPSKGRAPSDWIIELVGRRETEGFASVMAVSSTGFSKGAVRTARENGIELRTLTEVKADELAEWLANPTMLAVVDNGSVQKMTINFAPDILAAHEHALRAALEHFTHNDKIFCSKDGDLSKAVSGLALFNAQMRRQSPTFSVEPIENEPVRVRIPVDPGNPIYVVTANGTVPVGELVFKATRVRRVERVPAVAYKYAAADGSPITSVAEFPLPGVGAAVSLHQTGDGIRVMLRKADKKRKVARTTRKRKSKRTPGR